MLVELLEHPAFQGAILGSVVAAGGALVRLITRQARMDELVRLDERQVSGTRQMYTHLEQLSQELEKWKD